ncbi:MAG: glutaredoxin [Gammaproteobacteria bacterium]|nr:glutaredoxin [Gammaproteobacteria bacterium]
MSILIEVFASPGCPRCGKAKEVLQAIATELGGGRIEYREIDVVEDLDYAVRLGVLATPAIAFDGRLIFTGLPPVRALRAELARRLSREDGVRRA